MSVWLQKNRASLLAPLVFLAVSCLAFGLQAAQQGFYLDDWIILNVYNRGGALGVFEYAFWGNRPLVFWLWVIGFKLFNSTPVYWQVWALLWRWLTVIIVWLAMRRLWPKAALQVALAALLFAVYPLFRQQASALTYSFHWICFFLWGASIYCMIRAVQTPRRFVPWMAAAVLTGAVQLFSQEFFVGLELLRPVVVWLAYENRGLTNRERLRRSILAWAPFLVMLGGYLVWRTQLMPTPGSDRNTPGILYGLLTAPLSTLPRLAVMFFQDLIQILLGTWYETYQPGLVTLTPISSLAAWGVAGAAFLIALGYAWFAAPQQPREDQPAVQARPWYITAVPFGLLAIVLGFAPGWMIGRHIYDLTGAYNDRFGLAAMLGAAVVVVGLLDMLIKTRTYQVVIVCLLVGLGTGQNFRYEVNYRWSWEKQTQLFWQLKWRAPELVRPTTIFGDGSMVSYLGSWVTTSAISQMYGTGPASHNYDFWYQDVSKIDVDGAVNDQGQMNVVSSFMHYQAPADSGLVIDYQPDRLQCLWVLGAQDAANPYLSDPLAQAVPLSHPDRIIPETNRPLQPDIFGSEPAHEWCYYYQKGDLARQLGHWAEAVSLWQMAEENGKHPRVGVEYGAFIEGFAHTGDWENAVALTRKAAFPKYEMRAYLCTTWARIASTTEKTPARAQTLKTVIEDFECQDEIQ